jgi:ribonuclease HII
LPNDYNNDKIDDSKKVSAITRKKLSDEIKKIAIDYKIIFVDSATIDKEGNIKSTTIKTMKKIVKMLDPIPDVVLVDAENIEEADAPKSESIIKGDGKSISIAAASILAKVARDEYMVEVLDKQYPQFYFKNNKGYGTKQHIDALKKNKPIPGIHRFSYEPIKKLVE